MLLFFCRISARGKNDKTEMEAEYEAARIYVRATTNYLLVKVLTICCPPNGKPIGCGHGQITASKKCR